MIYFLDTNIFIRFFVKEDKTTFDNCFHLLKLIESNKINAYISSIILAEVAWTFNRPYKFSRTKIAKHLKSIIALKNLKFADNMNLIRAIELYSKYNIKFVDCLIASDENLFNKKAVLISYDKDFDKLPIKRIEPEELVKNFKK
ncbi:MAG: hypothetical protein COX44_03255 [Candidatus Portnoybacteria bacterium CG23_combo_of_CG06-09_8_20_14_all_37_13]|uniref:PIN domain-containing protein n=2 Tax=Parcubacteria group TaxID=1794811 RepID=A0A1J4TX17_9BACT|nr:MAG: hypothetical protein AUJ29_03175 [Candidatus Kuenenbacteria bacterium CG1_02_38_13]PIP16826.1 MAG: hypothetical protein COX44_03255 [Candidatus Portnoybacteria bacterium CG23_combo_of_CG06-09_8_20_14_all_37_13]